MFNPLEAPGVAAETVVGIVAGSNQDINLDKFPQHQKSWRKQETN